MYVVALLAQFCCGIMASGLVAVAAEMHVGSVLLAFLVVLVTAIGITWKAARSQDDIVQEAVDKLMQQAAKAAAAHPLPPPPPADAVQTRTLVRLPEEVIVTSGGGCYHVRAWCGGLPPQSRTRTLRRCQTCCLTADDGPTCSAAAASSESDVM